VHSIAVSGKRAHDTAEVSLGNLKMGNEKIHIAPALAQYRP
jgi:hypothetical protein